MEQSISRDVRDVVDQWARLTGITVVFVSLGLLTLLITWERPPSRSFVGGTLIGLALVLGVCWRTITGARRAEGTEPITFATVVTAIRASALILLAGFLLVVLPTESGLSSWVPGILFAIAAGFDAIDGVIARATDTVSELGGRLDVEIDALTVLLGSALAVRYGTVPTAFLAVGLARYAFVAGIHYRRRRGRPVYGLDPSHLRRALGALAMIAIWVALLPVPGTRVSQLFATVVLLPFVLNFVRDWFVVSGTHPVSRP